MQKSLLLKLSNEYLPEAKSSATSPITSPMTSPSRSSSSLSRRSSSLADFFNNRKSPSPRDNATQKTNEGRETRETRVLKVDRIKTIGTGSTGTVVYKAKIDGGLYCIKELDLSAATDRDIAFLKKEIDILQTLPRENVSSIVNFIGFQQTADKLQIIMSLYEGTLHKLIHRLKQKNKKQTRKQYFSTLDIVNVCEQVLTGLCVLHDNRIMHRDLKSTNILYDGDDTKIETANLTFVIADLGESKLITNADKARTVVGSPGWIAPEVLKCNLWGQDNYYTYSADIWSFGMLIYEMMTLYAPFYDEKFASNATAEGKKPTLSQEVRDRYSTVMSLYELCTAVDPDERPTAAEALRTVVIMKEAEMRKA